MKTARAQGCRARTEGQELRVKIQKQNGILFGASLGALFCLFLQGCASTHMEDLLTPANPDSLHPAKDSKNLDTMLKLDGDSVTTSSEGAPTNGPTMSSAEIFYREKKIENAQFDLPVEMNHDVQKWVDYFTGRGRDRFEKYLERSEYFIPFLKPILKNAKAPEDLVYLALIESGFNNNAKSHARAVGAWQFISATGRRYGLEINWWVDERRDVEKSTIAAIQYLKELNAMFGSWHLAAAAYNAGEAKIQRAIKKYKTNDFWALTKYKYLKPETKNYVPKLFAAAIICKNKKQFGFEEDYSKIKHISAAMISEKAEETDDLAALPESLDTDAKDKTAVADDAAPAEPSVELTKDSPDPEEDAILKPDSVESMLRNMSNTVRVPHVNRKGEVNGSILTEIEIPSPADLFKVSSAASLSYMEFKSMNPELLRWLTPPDQKTYKVRIPLSHKDSFMKKYFNPAAHNEVNFLTYKARSGDTPQRVAKRFGINADPIVMMNGVRNANSNFAPGKMVELPIPSDFVRSLASLKSLDLYDPPEKKSARRHRRHRSHSKAQARSGAVESSEAQSGLQFARKRL